MSDSPNNPKIELRIREILRGSRLPAERREEIAEEFRGHLEQLIESKRAIVDEEAATDAALAAFGTPDVIRRSLRRRQSVEDHRQVLASMRQRLTLLLVIPALNPLYIPIFATVRSGEFLRAVLFAVMFYFVMLIGGFAILYPFLLARIRVRHRIPAGECRPLVSAVYWFTVFALSSVLFVLIFVAGAVSAFASLAFRNGPSGIDPARFAWEFARLFIPEGGPVLMMIAGLVAVVLAGVQRRRCVAEG